MHLNVLFLEEIEYLHISFKFKKMKTHLMLIAFGLSSSLSHAQKLKEADVPATVLQAFQKEYPGTKAEKWEKEGVNYEVEFDLNKTETSVVYTATGAFVEKEVEIKASELPKFVLEYFEKNMPGKKIKEANITTTANGILTYEAEVEDTEYRFQEAVGLIEQEKGNDEDKD
jgi:Putative beta-lactamase-inhibitor-like, PepSY-like